MFNKHLQKQIAWSKKAAAQVRPPKDAHQSQLRVLSYQSFFQGTVPDELYIMYKSINKMYQVIPERPFPKKRLMINVFEWLMPQEVVVKIARCSREFYMVTWNMELLKKVAENALTKAGLLRFREALAQQIGKALGVRAPKKAKRGGSGIKIKHQGEESGSFFSVPEDAEFYRKMIFIIGFSR